jgi:serine/threonine protein kinase
MELVEHVTLADCCAGQPLEPAEVVAMGAQLADTLAYGQADGVVHRDITPGNILLASGDRCLLNDFGIAKLLGDIAAGLTATGFTLGTAAYLSPGHVSDQSLTTGTDVYSLGLVLLGALTGQRVYPPAPTPAAWPGERRHRSSPRICPQSDAPCSRRMTAFEPADCPTGAQTGAALDRLAGGLSASDAPAAQRNSSRTAIARSGDRAARGCPQLRLIRARWPRRHLPRGSSDPKKS